MKSLKKELILWTIGAAIFVLATAGMVLYFIVKADFVEQFDKALIDKAKLLASMVEIEGGKIDFQFDEFDMYEFDRTGGPSFLQIWNSRGETVYQSLSLKGKNLGKPFPEKGNWIITKVTLPNGNTGRLATVLFYPPIEKRSSDGEDATAGKYSLSMAREMSGIENSLNRFWVILVIVGFISITVASSILFFIITKSTRPLGDLSNEITMLDSESASKRVTGRYEINELAPIKRALNELLGRIEESFNREKTFSSNVSHELRTPLAGLLTTIDVALLKEREKSEYIEVLRDSLLIAKKMKEMVEKLLLLSKIECGHKKLDISTVNISEIIENTKKYFQHKITEKALDLVIQINQGIEVNTDREYLEIVLYNIVENALNYSDKNSTVKIESRLEGSALIKISNPCKDFKEENISKVFDRFWRADESRNLAEGHSGLGMSLVAKIMSVLGGSASIEYENGLFSVILRLPIRF